MDMCFDMLEWLGPDTSASVLTFLDDPADLVRFSAVSRSWRRFVPCTYHDPLSFGEKTVEIVHGLILSRMCCKNLFIANGFCKKLCLRMCLEVSYFDEVNEVSSPREFAEVGSSTATEWESLEKEHRAYSYLSYCLVSPAGYGNCIAESICASSTDNYPDESIEHTLIESDQVDMRPSYWSSEGERDPGVPEMLTYRLGSKLCIINEIKIQPFEAYFQYGNPIYSAKAVRFRMGHSRSPQVTETEVTDTTIGQGTPNEDYVWTYVSPSFLMLQENCLQSFKLPRPVICVGGILQIELLGRIQVQDTDRLYYICVSHVQVIGRPLAPVFDINIIGDGQRRVLKFSPPARDASSPKTRSSSVRRTLRERIKNVRARRGWNNRILNRLLGVSDSDDDSDAA